MRKTIDRDRERAVTLICKSIVSADISVVRKMLCLIVGHPPLIKFVEGLAYCLRCEGRSKIPAEDSKVTPTDLLLTPVEVVRVSV